MAAGQQCERCGCELSKDHVRQVALSYRDDRPAMFAVQYHCPECGASHWRHCDPQTWDAEALELAAEWCVGEVAEALVAKLPAVAGYDLTAPIGLDEVIDFALWLAGLRTADLSELADSVL